MSAPIDDGGPAFPVQTIFNPHTGEPTHTGCYWDGNGMTLRDHFAGRIMAAMNATLACKTDWPEGTHLAVMAQNAYEQADAMIEARKGSQ